MGDGGQGLFTSREDKANIGSAVTSTSSLAGKRVLGTGGSRGIGAAIVRRPASQGATVAVMRAALETRFRLEVDDG